MKKLRIISIQKKIKGTKVDDNILNNRIDMQLKENEILSIDSLIKSSKFLTLKIIHLISNLNNMKIEEEIPFKKEAHILVDCEQTISNENRVLNQLFVCGLANALNNLEIKYSLNLIGDSAMEVRIKEAAEPHSELAFQKFNFNFVLYLMSIFIFIIKFIQIILNIQLVI